MCWAGAGGIVREPGAGSGLLTLSLALPGIALIDAHALMLGHCWFMLPALIPQRVYAFGEDGGTVVRSSRFLE